MGPGLAVALAAVAALAITLASAGAGRLLRDRAKRRRRAAPDLPPAPGPERAEDAPPLMPTRLDALSRLDDLTVGEAMVHRTNMQLVNADDPPARIVEEALASPYTRLPLWRGEPENIVGVLHAKDLFRAYHAVGGDLARLDPARHAAPPWFVPDHVSLRDQLNAFLKRKNHFAIVVDEYGEVMGLLTLEDILEEIVGDIADEHDPVVLGVRPDPDGSVTVDGGVPIRDLNRTLGWHLPDGEATTLAGLVIHEARMIPEERQAFTFHGFRFLVLKRDRNRLALIRITPVAGDAPLPARRG